MWLAGAVLALIIHRKNQPVAASLQDQSPGSASEGKTLQQLLQEQKESDDVSVYRGEGPNYTWSQTEDEVEVTVTAQEGTDFTKKDIFAEYHKTRVVLRVQGAEILNGNTPAPIDPDECTWQINRHTGAPTFVSVALKKKKRSTKAETHWRCVVMGHAEVCGRSGGPRVMALNAGDPKALKRAVDQLKSPGP